MKVFICEEDNSILIQFSPETRDEDRQIVRLGLRAKAIEGGSVDAYCEENHFFGEIILPATKARNGLKIKMKS